MCYVETNFKRYAKKIGILRTKYNKTEIIETDDIDAIIDWFDEMISVCVKLSWPQNQRGKMTGMDEPDIEVEEKKCYLCSAAFRRVEKLAEHLKICAIYESAKQNTVAQYESAMKALTERVNQVEKKNRELIEIVAILIERTNDK
jgi:hypothetical protein